jgi:8-oxo-dGTP diphosphatase
VYIGRAEGEPLGSDDAVEARAFPADQLPQPLCFDHSEIVADYLRYRRSGRRRAL